MKKSNYRFLFFVCILSIMLAGTLTAQEPGPVAKNASDTRGAITVLPGSLTVTDSPDSSRPLSKATDLTRVGVQTLQQLPLSLQDAVRRALLNNNDIEVSRDDVRFQETQVRSLLGIYDPVFTTNPRFSRNSETGSPTATLDRQHSTPSRSVTGDNNSSDPSANLIAARWARLGSRISSSRTMPSQKPIHSLPVNFDMRSCTAASIWCRCR